jgi:hypothetical protein
MYSLSISNLKKNKNICNRIFHFNNLRCLKLFSTQHNEHDAPNAHGHHNEDESNYHPRKLDRISYNKKLDATEREPYIIHQLIF